jgi:hypothetical protein
MKFLQPAACEIMTRNQMGIMFGQRLNHSSPDVCIEPLVSKTSHSPSWISFQTRELNEKLSARRAISRSEHANLKAYSMMCAAYPGSKNFIKSKVSNDGIDSTIDYINQNFINSEMNSLLLQSGNGYAALNQFSNFKHQIWIPSHRIVLMYIFTCFSLQQFN